MKATQFSFRGFGGAEAQKAIILKQGDEGVPVAEIWRKAGIHRKLHGLLGSGRG